MSEHITPYLSAETLAARIQELGKEIERDFAGESVLFVSVLKGSFIFAADLARAISNVDLSFAFLGVSSYEGTSSTGTVRITHDLGLDITDQNVLLVEDIVDTGLTLRYLKSTLGVRSPKALKVVTLLDKPSRRKTEITPDYCGFEIPDEFVVGFGLDFDQRFRQLPFVGIFRS